MQRSRPEVDDYYYEPGGDFAAAHRIADWRRETLQQGKLPL